jgi:hypothetical protein
VTLVLGKESGINMLARRRPSRLFSGFSILLYGIDSSREVDRVAIAEFGGHLFTFTLTATSEQHTPITADIPLYLGMLSGFAYLGSG